MSSTTTTNYDNNASAVQDAEAVKSYKEKSAIQKETFQYLLSFANIEKGWKILDMGCGTGNNTALLAEIVGKEGKVIGTDPIKERIEEASQCFKRDNLEFFKDFGKNSFKYGQDFDVAFSNYVMHWIPTEEKPLTFKGVADSLRPGGKFIFTQSPPESNNTWVIGSFLPEDYKAKVAGDFYFSTEEEYKKMALENGFKNVTIEHKHYNIVYESIDALIEWFAASMHNIEHQQVVDVLKNTASKNDFSFLYNEKGEVEHRYIMCFYTCTK